MIPHELRGCAEVLLDLICYEVFRDKLSPETEAILAEHLAECEFCRIRFFDFKQLVEERTTYIQ